MVVLSPEEMERAAAVAKRLHDSLRAKGVRDAHGLRKKDATTAMEAGGSQSELAVAKFYGVKWTAGEDGHDQFGPDVGTRTQVRSSNVYRPKHRLIIRDRDIVKYGDVPFVLVIQQGNRFELRGWMMAHDAAKPEHLWDGGDPGRPPAYFVHEDKLHDPTTLEAP